MGKGWTRWAAVAVVALLASTTAGCGGTSSAPDGEPAATGSSTPTLSPTDPAAYAEGIVDETNRARVDEGLPVLAESTCAGSAAVARAQALVGSPELEHAPMDDVLAACAPRTSAAENLSRAAATPHEIVTAWLGSYGHRQNLLDPGLTDLGVGCVRDAAAMLCSQVYLGP